MKGIATEATSGGGNQLNLLAIKGQSECLSGKQPNRKY